MARVTITITRKNVYAIAEGISVTISQHNGGTPTFEQLWASESESRKLDIHYREAVSDLERKLMEWLTSSTAKFNLTADGSDYTLTLDIPHWPTRLEGLLSNKIQDYLVHAVTAGWLNDFEGLSVKQDYAGMAAQELADIRIIVYQRSFDWDEAERTEDGEEKQDGIEPTAEARTVDTQTKEDGIEPTTEARTVDTQTKEDGIEPTTEARTVDTQTKEDGIEPTAGKRKDDSKKDYMVLPADPISRKKDDIVKPSEASTPPLCRPVYARHKDNATVKHYHEYTDWSGTDFGRLNQMPHKGMKPGYYPHRRPEHGGRCPEHKVAVQRQHTGQHGHCCQQDCPQEHPHNPFEHTGCHGRQHPSNDYSEEKFINSHRCGHHDCGHHGVNPLDWDFDEAESGELDDATFTENR